MTEICGVRSSVTSSSTSRASCLPSLRSRRIRSRPSWRPALPPVSARPAGPADKEVTRRSTSRSSAAAAARSATRARRSSFTSRIAASTRSRAMESTSRPTYPTSVNFEASTFTNGASTRRARRRAISVLPTPVGPIMRMFFGIVSRCSSGARRWRRQRSRSAIATARFAFVCPTTWRSSSATILRGERSRRRCGVTEGSRRGSRRSCRCRSTRRSRGTPSRSRPRRGPNAGAAPGRPPPRTGRRSPTASTPSSGAMTSPVPERRSEIFASATTRRASSWRSVFSVRQSVASSTAARSSWPWNSSSFFSNRVKSVTASAVEPAKPARTFPFKEAPHLRGAVLHDGRPHRDLAVAAERDDPVPPHAEDRRVCETRSAHAPSLARQSLSSAFGWLLR